MKNIVFLFFVFSVFSLHSQSKADELLDEAVNIYNFNKREEAKTKVIELISRYPTYLRSYFVKAHWDIKDRNYSEAIKNLKKLEELKIDFNPLQEKMLAESYFNLKDYTQARNYITLFLKTRNLSPPNLFEANQLLKNIDFVQAQSETNDYIQFENMGPNINTTESEYFPSTTADESKIYFTRKTHDDEDIWISSNSHNTWSRSRKIDEPQVTNIDHYVSINTDENDGAHTIAPSGKYLFFTSCDRPHSFGSCDLFFSKLEGEEWQAPKILLPPVNTKSWESQPCITADGKLLYFASAREGSLGMSDLYVSEITENGKFTEPKNLGDIINTKGSEDRPFIHPDGKTLYFSSNGHPGYGGRDLYMSKLENGEWTKPINLGNQINSSGDELSIFINTLGNKAYIAKQNLTEGREDFDLYTFELPVLLRPDKTTFIKGIVVDAKNNKPINAKVKLFDPSNDNVIMSMSNDNVNGTFLMTLVEDRDYGFNVNSTGYSIFSNSYSFSSKQDGKPQELVIKLSPLTTGTSFTLKNVLFETGKFNLKTSSTTELDNVVEILTTNPTIKIQIAGHTDNVGATNENKLLSENRAKSVVEYLVSKGITRERLKSIGYGSTKPISTNDTEEGRAQNRRTEIEIL